MKRGQGDSQPLIQSSRSTNARARHRGLGGTTSTGSGDPLVRDNAHQRNATLRSTENEAKAPINSALRLSTDPLHAHEGRQVKERRQHCNLVVPVENGSPLDGHNAIFFKEARLAGRSSQARVSRRAQILYISAAQAGRCPACRDGGPVPLGEIHHCRTRTAM